MIRRHFFLAAAGLVLVLMILALLLRSAFGGEESDGGKKGGGPGGGRSGGQVVSVATATERSFSNEIRVLGVARGQRSLNITSPTSQLITRVYFRDGQTVRAGAPLVELKAGEEDAQIAQAQARVAQAERQYQRYADLGERGYAPQTLIDQYQTELETARAALASAQTQRADRVLRAPFSGVMGLSTVTPGTYVSPGSVIATLDDISLIRVDFPLPERYIGVVRAGLPIRATSDAYGDRVFGGRIALIDTRVNEQSRAVTARAEIPNPGGLIRPGMSVQVAVTQGERMAAAVPESALQYEGEGAFVYRIAQGERGATAQRVEVETGAVEGGFVEILSGLMPGDQVVGQGLNRIQPGAPIRVEGSGAERRGTAPRAGAGTPSRTPTPTKDRAQ